MRLGSDGDLPVFGRRVAGQRYIPRPGAYVLIQNAAGALAVVRTPEGYFLPGGGIEPGETPEEAAVREAREECGIAMRAGAVVGQAVQFVYSRAQRAYYQKVCTYIAGDCGVERVRAVEADHHLEWLSLDAAVKALSLESDRWAVGHCL